MTDQHEERCVLCLDEKRSPVRIQCGHSFCHECLDVYKTYHKYPWANKCPICRGVLKDTKRMSKSRMTPTNVSHHYNQSRTSVHRETSSSTATTAAEEQTCILEEFIAIATDEDSTPSEWGDVSGMEDIEMNDEDDDDDDDNGEGQFFTDSDEDSYYYFEEDLESWDQESSIVNVDDYEPEVVNDSEVIVLTNEEGSWSGSRLQTYQHDINASSSDLDVVIVDDSTIVIVD